MIFAHLSVCARNAGVVSLCCGLRRTAFVVAAVMSIVVGSVWPGEAVADQKTIGISVRSLDQGRFTDLLIPVVKAAASKAGYDVVIRSAEDSIEKQAADIASFVSEGVAGIVVGLVNSDASPLVGAAAADAGTPVVFMNVSPINIDQLPLNQAYVGPDEYSVGTAQALAVCEALPGGGQVGLLIGNLLHPAAAARTKAVQDTIRSEECNGVELRHEETAQWNRAFATEVTLEWLASGLGLDAVIANNDPMALGAIDALTAQGIDPATLFITSVDGQPDAIEAVRNGTLDLTFLQDVNTQGVEIFRKLSRIMNGQSYDAILRLPLIAISADTVESRIDG